MWLLGLPAPGSELAATKVPGTSVASQMQCQLALSKPTPARSTSDPVRPAITGPGYAAAAGCWLGSLHSRQPLVWSRRCHATVKADLPSTERPALLVRLRRTSPVFA